MTVLFDNCTSPRMARTLHVFIACDGDNAVQLGCETVMHATWSGWNSSDRGKASRHLNGR